MNNIWGRREGDIHAYAYIHMRLIWLMGQGLGYKSMQSHPQEGIHEGGRHRSQVTAQHPRFRVERAERPPKTEVKGCEIAGGP